MKVILIRHGQTAGNAEKRYIGVTDQPLTASGVEQIEKNKYPAADLVFASPLKRCLQTAAIIYPQQKPTVVRDLREMDFGDFENKNHMELSGNADYQRWIDNGGKTAFPGGEHPADFCHRCTTAFLKTMESIKNENCQTVAFAVHGGTIMAIMSSLLNDTENYFSYRVDNGDGYTFDYADGQISNQRKLFE